MVLEQAGYERGMVFNLTCEERGKVENAKFMQKPDIIKEVNRMNFSKNLLRLKNIVYIDGEFRKQEIDYVFPNDKDKFAFDMMDISMAYAILWLNTDVLGFNEIAVAKTAHHTTNIDADVIGAFLDRIGEADNG
jgi:hypothetical protein